MYRTCRHIKPNGLRCESPALKETYFCYFHSKLHSLGAEQYEKFGPMRLPTPEGRASIQLSIAKITDALITGRIDPKRAGQLLYAMQIASQNLESHLPDEIDQQVDSMTINSLGEELAPEKFVCDFGKDDCNECPYSTEDQCTNWYHAGNEEEEEDEDEHEDEDEDEDEEDDDEDESPQSQGSANQASES